MAPPEIPDATARDQTRRRVAARLEARLGPRWRSRLARALAMPQPSVSRIFSPPAGRTDAPSATLQALAEALQAIPDHKLPPRWRD